MTAPSAPGVALYEGCFGVTRGPDGKGGEVLDTLKCVNESGQWKPWNAGGRLWGENGRRYYGGNEHDDIIHVEPTRKLAEAWLRAYRDAQDRATNPERAVAEVPEGGWGAEVLPAKPFNPVDWTPAPQPEAVPTPGPDWEARRWEAALSAAQGLAGNCDETGLCAWLPEPLAVRAVQIADALIATVQEKKL